ncbi:hypothetical protein [Streptomyces sp. NBC_01803]|uniref:hypothetical protein n=1 Tax=Streptomyces sp. NBC_01803 TaxID=2975946 RepID=UPI002DD9B064|nr:hypothetical protein [Streptomyces sp. NBC_01803]WSA46443.1 hypothetical protein OIE51_21005 [Streptomyces sp. NBC_01803]
MIAVPEISDAAVLAESECGNNDVLSQNQWPSFRTQKECAPQGGATQSGEAAPGAAMVCLGMAGGELLVLPLTADPGEVAVEPRFDRLCAEDAHSDVGDALHWLMPSLSRALISEVLGLGSRRSDGC